MSRIKRLYICLLAGWLVFCAVRVLLPYLGDYYRVSVEGGYVVYRSCMDMEAYAVVRAARLHATLRGEEAPTIYMAKVVSDGCDGSIGDWESRIVSLRPKVRSAAEEIIDAIEKL